MIVKMTGYSDDLVHAWGAVADNGPDAGRPHTEIGGPATVHVLRDGVPQIAVEWKYAPLEWAPKIYALTEDDEADDDWLKWPASWSVTVRACDEPYGHAPMVVIDTGDDEVTLRFPGVE